MQSTFQLQHLAILLLSFPSGAVNFGCRGAKRAQHESSCGDLASETATPWRPPLEAPLWVSTCSLNEFMHYYICRDLLINFYGFLFFFFFSFFTLDDRKGTHFTTRDLKSLGFHFCDTLLDFCDPDQTKVRDKTMCQRLKST